MDAGQNAAQFLPFGVAQSVVVRTGKQVDEQPAPLFAQGEMRGFVVSCNQAVRIPRT